MKKYFSCNEPAKKEKFIMNHGKARTAPKPVTVSNAQTPL